MNIRNLLVLTALTGLAAACGDDDPKDIDGSMNEDGGTKTGPCGDVEESEPNDDRDSAEGYAIGDAIRGCIGAEDDADWYELTVPDGAAGGYVGVTLTAVGDDTPRVEIYSQEDNGKLHDFQAATSGGDVETYFAAATGGRYRIAVVDGVIGVPGPYRYTLTATYTALEDDYEPNDTREEATPIEVGETVTARLFAGFEDSVPPDAVAYQDWYEVELAAGTASIEVQNIPGDTRISVSFRDTDDAEIVVDSAADVGANLTVTTPEPIAAGTYRVRVSPAVSDVPLPYSDGDQTPDHFTRDYTLVVTQ